MRGDPKGLADARKRGGDDLVASLRVLAHTESDLVRRLDHKLELLEVMKAVSHTTSGRSDELFSLHILAIKLERYDTLLPYAREYVQMDLDAERPAVQSMRCFFCAIAFGAAGAFAEANVALRRILELPEQPAQFPFWYVEQLIEAAALGDQARFREWAHAGPTDRATSR